LKTYALFISRWCVIAPGSVIADVILIIPVNMSFQAKRGLSSIIYFLELSIIINDSK